MTARTTDRLPVDFYEPDEEGFIQSYTDEDGRVIGVEIGLYVVDPWNQGDPEGAEGIAATMPQDGYAQWIEARYPGISDWDFCADDATTALVSGEYRDGESTDDLIMRLTRGNRDFNRLRDEGTMFYTLRNAWADHVGVDLYPESETR